jgi:hypothetical protein
MERVEQYRSLIKQILSRHEKLAYANSRARKETVFDEQADRYLLIAFGREEDNRRVHGIVIHVEIIDGKIWVQYDGTEYGVAQELVDAGVPKDRIVLGFKSPEMRKYTEFAAA